MDIRYKIMDFCKICKPFFLTSVGQIKERTSRSPNPGL